MKSQVDAAELTERIRREARRHQASTFPASPGTEAAGEDNGVTGLNGALLPPAPVLAITQPGGFSCESLLAQIGNMLERARGKSSVRRGVPRLLRPFYRNQGGYNDIVLEALERLREVNRSLLAENAQLRLHAQRQAEWMQAVERQFAQFETPADSLGEPASPCAKSALDAQSDSDAA